MTDREALDFIKFPKPSDFGRVVADLWLKVKYHGIYPDGLSCPVDFDRPLDGPKLKVPHYLRGLE